MPDDFSSFLTSTAGGTGLKPPAGDLSKSVDTTLSEFDKRAAESVASMKKIEEKYRDPMQKNIAESHAILEKMRGIKAPDAPNLEKLPDSPDTQFKDPTQALGSMASVLAILGSLMTRAPMTAALNAGAAAMQGFHKGDTRRVQLERTKFHDELEKGLRQNQEEMQKYSAALQKANFDMSKSHGEMTALAAEFKDEQLLAALESGNVQMQYQILTDRTQIGLKVAGLLSSEKLRLATIQAAGQARADARADRQAMHDESRKDRLMQFDALHGTNLSGIIAGAGGQGAVPKNATVAKEIDELISFVQKNPSVVGSVGWARAIPEAVAGSLSSVPFVRDIPFPEGGKMDPLHQEFGSRLAKLQLDMRDALIKGGKSAKWQMDYIDQIVRGRGVFDTPAGTIQALDTLKELYGGGTAAPGTGIPPLPDGFQLVRPSRGAEDSW